MTASPKQVPSGGDEHFMRFALDVAERGRGYVEPNPMVGCVLVRSGAPIASGYHRRFGGPHAEIDALGALSDPAEARGATAYVTLEPCCHQGKTPPCTDALIAAGISRVVIAMQDPFRHVDGGGIRQLRQAGLEVTVGVLAAQAGSLNAPYLKKVLQGKPWVIGKWAMTVDGRIATATGESQWITGAAARNHVHQTRGRVDAVVIGMGTAEADDPMLTARLEGQATLPRIATRVVFCRHRLPALESKLVRSARQFPLLLVAGQSMTRNQLAPLVSAGATVLETDSNDTVPMVDTALSSMSDRGMTNILVEGGSELLASFFSAGQIDECHVYLGAKVVGGKSSPGPIGGVGMDRIRDAWALELISVDQLGDDLLAIYRRKMDGLANQTIFSSPTSKI